MPKPSISQTHAKLDPMENSVYKPLKGQQKGELKRCPYCSNVNMAALFKFQTLFMPPLNPEESTGYVPKGSEGHCPDCDRFVTLTCVEDVPEA